MEKFLDKIKNPKAGKRMVILGVIYFAVLACILAISLAHQFCG